MNAIETIKAQQKGIEYTAAWAVGEQLKEICAREPAAAEIVAQDIKRRNMSIKDCAEQIKKYADAHKTGNFAFVSPTKAEEIIRRFYGIEQLTASAPTPAPSSGKLIDLDDFL